MAISFCNSHQQWTRVLITLHPHQYLVLSSFIFYFFSHSFICVASHCGFNLHSLTMLSILLFAYWVFIFFLNFFSGYLSIFLYWVFSLVLSIENFYISPKSDVDFLLIFFLSSQGAISDISEMSIEMVLSPQPVVTREADVYRRRQERPWLMFCSSYCIQVRIWRVYGQREERHKITQVFQEWVKASKTRISLVVVSLWDWTRSCHFHSSLSLKSKNSP